MGDLRLKFSDNTLQYKCETIMQQFGWGITRRTVCEDREMPPMLTYRLENGSKHDEMLEVFGNIGYGPSDEPTLTIKGKKSVLSLTLRQLSPTNTVIQGGLKTFGDGGDE